MVGLKLKQIKAMYKIESMLSNVKLQGVLYILTAATGTESKKAITIAYNVICIAS